MSNLQDKLLFPFIAPPNGGKGTQTNLLSKNFSMPKIDMGGMLRYIAKEDTELARQVRERQENGHLVETSIVLEVLKTGLKKLAEENPTVQGFILDGFPRSLEQVDGLIALCKEENTKTAKVFYLRVPDDVILERAVSRRLCPTCNEIYNLKTKPPKVDNKCDVDGSELIQRVDDQQEMVKERLRSFEAETRPILTRFKEMGNLVEVNGNRSAEEVTADISKELQESLSDLLPA